MSSNLLAVKEVARIVSEMSGIQLGEKQFPMIENRLKSRLIALGIPDFDHYLQYLKTHKEQETQALLSLITTHHTYFFREFSHFEFIEQEALPKLLPMIRKRINKKLRVWSAACSRGHEVWSLALFLDRAIEKNKWSIDFDILGTDIDPDSVEMGRNGVFPSHEVKQIPALYSDGNFIFGTGEVEGFAKIKDRFRRHVQFDVLNLFEMDRRRDEPFDLIFCRNVFIYFNRQQIESLSLKLLERIQPDGYFFVGVSESLTNYNLPIVSRGVSIYQRKDAPSLTAQTSDTSPFCEPSSAATPIKVGPLQVLCVDDSPSIHSLMSKMLTPEHGFVVKGKALNGLEALEILKTQSFDVITLDLQMPELDGLGFLKKYTSSVAKDKKIPVVIVSSLDRDKDELAKMARANGAFDYVEKPSLQNISQASEEIRAKLKLAARSRPSDTLAAPRAIPSGTSLSASNKPLPLRSTPPKTFMRAAANKHPQVHFSGSLALQRQVTAVMPAQKSTLRSAVGSSCSTPGSSVGATLNSSRGISSERGHNSKSLTIASNSNLSSNSNSKKIRTLIVDDSQTIRNLLSKILSEDKDFEVVGMAETPSEAIKMIRERKPDLITLDIQMPEMTGVEMLRKLNPLPCPVVMISSISLTEGPLVLEALDLGAVDYIQKPKLEEVITIAPIIRERLKVAAEANVRAGKNSSRSSSAPKAKIYEKRETDLILIGASTGGTEAIRTVIEKWPNNLPPIAIVQHIPPVFSKAFADRLRQLCKIDVHEARGGEALLPGKAFVAAGGTQMKIVRRGEGLVTEVTDDPPVNRHKPAVDYMFDSVCNLKPFPNTLAIILTGMGQDGAKGLLNLKNKGAYTIAQNEESCVVFGMPKEAIKLGGAHRVLHLNDIADHVLQVVQLKKAGAQKVA